MVDLREAYASCERLAKSHAENFPVASMLLPRRMRPHVAAIYAFARVADDYADEGSLTPDVRRRLLDRWHDRLQSAVAGERIPPPAPGESCHAIAVFQALGATIRQFALPTVLFEDLLSAFRQDITVTRYATWVDLFDYCRRSANPVGRLLLRLAGHDNERLDRQSDAICTALQFTNFWQDLAIDAARGRIYLPQEELHRVGARIEGLGSQRLPPEWRAAVRAAVRRTRALFEGGRPLCDALTGRLRLELRATWLGGTRILDHLEAAGCDPVAERPRLRTADAPWFAWKIVSWA